MVSKYDVIFIVITTTIVIISILIIGTFLSELFGWAFLFQADILQPLSLCAPLQLAALNGRKEARGAARRSETIRIPVGVDRLQSADTPGRNPPSGWN